MINDHNITLVSATGSTKMGKRIGEVVGSRLEKVILELGGNNAIIVDETANMDLVVPAIVLAQLELLDRDVLQQGELLFMNQLKKP